MSSGPKIDPDEQPTLPPDPAGSEVEMSSAFDATIGHNRSGETKPANQESLPDFKDYELLEELGRGGMGVVYRAKHKSLDRTVALKMILGGQFASQEEIRRFQIEAESAARLDHPAIVPIFEVGESQGNHFFSMKLIDGKPLSESAEQYRDPRAAVATLIQVVHAVQHAHERGVLHRDLKPANILIDRDGQPMLTDLGLAKRMDDDSGLTRTGLVMGSPGFMSPEQAAGKNDITTAADVYALGAILYWLVTGRPPFQGESHLETIMQTIEQEPASVREYRPDADRGLNLICQKALQKDPDERYVSAAALAADLEAWLDGEPLSVRPPSALEVARIWMRKNFRAVAVAIGCGIFCGLYIGGAIFAMVLNEMAHYAELYERLGANDLPWAIRQFGWIGDLPRRLVTLIPTTFVWLNAAVAITMIGIIKPKSREIGMAASLTAGLLSGILAFSVSLGWSPIVDTVLRPSLQDTSLIATSMWTDDESERRLSRLALEQRYPGLANMEPNLRASSIYSKVYMDQSFAIPIGIWRGIWLTLCIAVLPIFTAGSFASWVWSTVHHKWTYYGWSLELGIYSSLFFLLLVKSFESDVGAFPGVGWHFGTLLGVAFGVWLSLKDAHWPWRIVGFVVATVAVFANFDQSAKIERAPSIMQRAATKDELLRAERYMEKHVTQKGGRYARYQLITLHAYLDHDQRYVAQCKALMNRFENAFRPEVAEQLAKCWLLKPELHTNLEIVHELAEIAVSYESDRNFAWFALCSALSHCRKGETDEAIQLAQRARDSALQRESSRQVYLVPTTHIIEALAHLRAGDQKSASASLATGEEAIDNSLISAAHNRFVYEVLRREALATLKSLNRESGEPGT